MSPTQFSVDLRALRVRHEDSGSSPHPRHASTVEQFIETLRSDRYSASQSPEAFAFAGLLTREDAKRIAEIIDELIACFPQEIAQNPFTGAAITALIEYGQAADVMNTLGYLAHHHPHEFATNVSLISALGTIATTGFTKRAATLLLSLSKEAPIELATNRCLGWALSEIADGPRGRNTPANKALEACAVLADTAPAKLAANTDAVSALEKLRGQNVNAVFAIEAKIAPFRDQSQRILGTRTFRHG